MTDFPIKTSIIVLIMLYETLSKKLSMCEINVQLQFAFFGRTAVRSKWSDRLILRFTCNSAECTFSATFDLSGTFLLVFAPDQGGSQGPDFREEYILVRFPKGKFKIYSF